MAATFGQITESHCATGHTMLQRSCPPEAAPLLCTLQHRRSINSMETCFHFQNCIALCSCWLRCLEWGALLWHNTHVCTASHHTYICSSMLHCSIEDDTGMPPGPRQIWSCICRDVGHGSKSCPPPVHCKTVSGYSTRAMCLQVQHAKTKDLPSAAQAFRRRLAVSERLELVVLQFPLNMPHFADRRERHSASDLHSHRRKMVRVFPPIG